MHPVIFYVYIGLIVILLIAIAIALLIVLPSTTTFFEATRLFPELCVIDKDSSQVIWKGLEPFTKNHSSLWEDDNGGQTLIIYEDNKYTNLAECADLIKACVPYIQHIPDVKRIGFYKLSAKTETKKQKRDARHNETLRAYFPIKLNGHKKSGIWVDGTTKHDSPEWRMYDATRIHSNFNEHRDKISYIMFIDLYRPKYIPLGIAR